MKENSKEKNSFLSIQGVLILYRAVVVLNLKISGVLKKCCSLTGQSTLHCLVSAERKGLFKAGSSV